MNRRPAVAAAVAVAFLAGSLAGCGAGADDAAEGAEGVVPPPGSVLLGRVGTPENPEAYEIALTTQDGTPVTVLEAGEYTIEVTDPATLHNFHLTGASVDESTTVPGTEETAWEVTFQPGEYTYQCDPHPSMTGTFDVT